jgi:heme/copper-type cytochrome/quinol oxidase subunit 4
MLAVPQHLFAGVTGTAPGLAHHGSLAAFVVGFLLYATGALIAFVVATRVTINIVPASL